MSLPEFSEFRTLLTKEKIMEITQGINELGVEVESSLSKEDVNSLLTAAATVSICATQEIIKLYHEWLSEQLQ